LFGNSWLTCFLSHMGFVKNPLTSMHVNKDILTKNMDIRNGYCVLLF
jgi:hypothetical protein